MSHLKLQKILYYIQALHLAYFDKPIINDDFQAWLHGPVSRKVFDKLKGLSKLYSEISYSKDEWNGASTPEEIIKSTLTEEQIDLIEEVIDKYSKLTSSQLENLSHSESPWIDARKGYSTLDKCEVVIPKDAMRSYYKSKLYD